MVDLVGELVQVPAALIMRVEPPSIAVVVASRAEANPFRRGERARLDTGLYCEAVMRTRRELLIPNALEDPEWCHNPDLKLGLVSYLGLPITWPDGRIFGTLCVLDSKTHLYGELARRVLTQFRDMIETDLRLLSGFDARLAEETRARLEESERARRTVCDTLEELRRTARELTVSQEKLREAVRLRDDFLSVASHELRTPITSLLLTVQSLNRSLDPLPPPEKLRRSLVLAERQIRKLTELVEELLELTRIHAGRVSLDREPVDLAVLVREVAQRFEVDLERSRCPLTVRGDPAVVGDWDRGKLEQIVTNLLSNAIKFGAGQPIEVTVEQPAAGTGRVRVSDGGIGIPADFLPHLFERFARGRSSSEYGGLGLGLFIVRNLVEALGGTVRAESEAGKGSTFTVDLDCGAAA
ncbi:MAG TPA: GAF domain-containing sensor histidine kinase [Myxococcales bacterium]